VIKLQKINKQYRKKLIKTISNEIVVEVLSQMKVEEDQSDIDFKNHIKLIFGGVLGGIILILI